MQFEICVDNLESVEIASQTGITRLELCSALAQGGLTPSYAFIQTAIRLSDVANFVMIRPRAGDFLFSQAEVNTMSDDILMAKDLGADGVVIGALTENRTIDLAVCEKLMRSAEGIGVTFHRAFDLCQHPEIALEHIIELGCERLLTSGQAQTALLGKKQIAQLVKQSHNRISIMPGAGVTAKNAKEIIETTKANELHFSAKSYRNSQMQNTGVTMGNETKDDKIMITNPDEVIAIKKQFVTNT